MSRNRILGYREHQVLAYVVRSLREIGIAPSYAMIRDELGMGTKAEVCRVVMGLERKGLLKRDGIGTVARRGVRRIRLVNVLTVSAQALG